MAKPAILRGIEVPGIHAGSRCAVMAGRTRTQYLIVINGYHRCPDIGAVAVLTDISGQGMQGAFAGGISAIVTTAAVIDDIGVIEVCGKPCDGRVAVIAIVAARDMRRMFADRGYAVMA